MKKFLSFLFIIGTVLGSFSQIAFSTSSNIEDAQKKYQDAIQVLGDLEKQAEETDRKTQEYAKENLPPAVAQKLKEDWSTLLLYTPKGLTIVQMLADPVMGVKSLLPGWLVDKMAFSKDEIKNLEEAKQIRRSFR